MAPSRAFLNAILAYYGLPDSHSIIRLGGWANQNFLVLTQDGHEYVLKLLVLQEKDLLVNDLAIQAQLAAADIQAPQYLFGSEGSILYENGSTRAVISDKIEGIHCHIRSQAFCFETGKTLALFHRAVHTLPKPHHGWLNPETAQRMLRWQSPMPLVQTAQQIIAENARLFSSGLPMGVIHGDLHEENVLVASEEQPAVTAVMDFEEAEDNLLLVDVARTILSVCRSEAGTSLHADKIGHLLKGYETIRPLEGGEKDSLSTALRYVVGVEAIWLIQHGFGSEAAEHMQRAHALPALDS